MLETKLLKNNVLLICPRMSDNLYNQHQVKYFETKYTVKIEGSLM